MKAFGFFLYFLFLFIGASSILYLGQCNEGGISSNPVGSNTKAVMTKSRKLKDNTNPPIVDQDNMGQVSLEDYRPINPVPNSKASIRPGPVQHDTPLMPYIPKPSPPPSRPKRGG